MRWLCLVWLCGCVHSASVECASGRLCPSGSVCDDALGICVDPGAFAACNGKPDDEACEVAGTPGSCIGGDCVPVVCGNGIQQPGELCDDGNRANGDGCRGDCLSDETCGNGVIDYALGE